MKKILIVDDHLMIREGLKLMLETTDDYEVSGEAENGLEALQLVEKLAPDLILMDLKMPVMSGMETIKRLKEKNIMLPIIILTTYNEDQLMAEGMDLGVNGYLLKDTSLEHLLLSIDKALHGEVYIDNDLQQRIQNHKKMLKEKLLTDLEIRTLQFVANGFKTKEIATMMRVSERTIKSRLTTIFNKFGVNSRSEAVAVAMHQNLITLKKDF